MIDYDDEDLVRLLRLVAQPREFAILVEVAKAADTLPPIRSSILLPEARAELVQRAAECLSLLRAGGAK
jgi:hypothetical protein